MTNRDPFRPLGDVDPPDLWSRAVAKAGDVDGDDLPAPRAINRGRRPMYAAVAAAVVVVAAVAGAVVLTDGGDDAGSVRASQPDAPAGQPSDAWGRQWELVSVTTPTGGEDIPPTMDGGVPTLSFFPDGMIGFQACNGGGATASIEGDRLVTDANYATTRMACGDDDGRQLMRLDAIVGDVLAGEPALEVVGDRLTITLAGTTLGFVDAGGPRIGGGEVASTSAPMEGPSPSSNDASAPPIVWSAPVGDSGCRIELSGVTADIAAANDGIAQGPADPAVIDWDLGGQPAAPGVVSVFVAGGQRVEFHVPGLMVIDLVGERTESVDLGARGGATVWFSEDWVQVRSFTGSQQGCDSFTVTVAGGTEVEDRALAVELAKQTTVGPA